tara:strand:- start:586 stop:1287 length:702 start_codon:yes stop_codon:yes gene_type:complete
MNLLQLIKSVKTDWRILLEIVYQHHRTSFATLEKILENDEIKFNGLLDIYPPKHKIFATFDFFHINDLKVVILGQDPYHGLGQAMGMCFSVPNEMKIPPSLKNIYKEIKDNYPSTYKIPSHGNLTHWNEQGILLLNTSLTVRQSSPNCYSKYWKHITDKIISNISEQTNSVVFLLWGNHAINKTKLIDEKKHYILTSKHPSPLSASRGGWFGNKHFVKTNEYLISHNKKPIEW